MAFPALTAFYGGLFGILFLLLSLRVSVARAQARAHHGDGGDVRLQRWIRIHANFTEYVPLTLLLIGLGESGGANVQVIRILLIVLLAARLAHVPGMLAREGSLQQYALRAPAIMVTWGVVLAASVLLILR